MTITSEDVKLIERFIDIRNRGYYCNSQELTDVYNRVLGKHVANTSCGSCMRQRISELETALNSFKAMVVKEEDKKPSETLETASLDVKNNRGKKSKK